MRFYRLGLNPHLIWQEDRPTLKNLGLKDGPTHATEKAPIMEILKSKVKNQMNIVNPLYGETK